MVVGSSALRILLNRQVRQPCIKVIATATMAFIFYCSCNNEDGSPYWSMSTFISTGDEVPGRDG